MLRRRMSDAETETYQLYYWPNIQGRGELVRLALEDVGAPYVDVARMTTERGGGVEAILRVLEGEGGGGRHFAPPILRASDITVSQTACILDFLAGRHPELLPPDELARTRALQLELTLGDLIAEAHDAHHPIGNLLYYEDQKEEAAKRSAIFLRERIPKFFSFFESVVKENKASKREHLVGSGFSYVDLSLFHVLSGLAYAFPNRFDQVRKDIPLLLALRDRVASRPRVSAYLGSTRRVPFSSHGIFRHYPELDP
jgi:glutathione S-transferase